jgi:hypothetical protein
MDNITEELQKYGPKRAAEIVTENFQCLDGLVEDEELRFWLRSLITTCLSGYAEEVWDRACVVQRARCREHRFLVEAPLIPYKEHMYYE